MPRKKQTSSQKNNDGPIVENIKTIGYCEEMETSYRDYATSVIVARALPDVRDGLKPVQRRNLYSMDELGVRHDKPYKKSARIVGDTMGKYHPHGDSSIYEAMVHMAQDWNYVIPLVDGHGNFGSIEGDGPAAMRYTESRLSEYSEDCLLEDLAPGIVDFVPNFDETEKEPVILPAKVPNILISGTEGIAVGMATKIPTHNFGEIIDGTIAYLDNEKITTKELMNYIKGPDFATGGVISNKKDLLEIYETGSGKVRIRAKVETEEAQNGKTNIVITEIPYTMIGAIDKFMETVADLVRNKKAPDITDISNQSGKEGIRIVIELRKNADVQKNINILYKKARLEDTFGTIMLAVKDQQPVVYSLKGILKEFVDFQLEIYRRKYEMLLEKELKNKEVKEGLVKACDLIDLIIEILRGSKTPKQARDCLMLGKTDGINFKTQKSKKLASSLNFTELQANAILEMRLQKLIGLEIDLLNKELKESIKNIKTYEAILGSKTKMKNTIKNELLRMKEKYSIPRRTIIKDEDVIVLQKEELVEQDFVMLMDRFGYAKLIDIPTFERNKESIPNDYKYSIEIKNTDKLLIFTDDGKMHSIKALDIPFGKYKDKGTPIDNLSNYDSSKENIVYINSGNAILGKYLLFVNDKGMAKKVAGDNFIVSKKTIDSTKLLEGEKLLHVSLLDSDEIDEIIMVSKNGNFIRFKLEEIPEKGKTAVGVRCIKLKDGDVLTDTFLGNNKLNFIFNENEVPFQRIKISKRDGVGTKVRL